MHGWGSVGGLSASNAPPFPDGIVTNANSIAAALFLAKASFERGDDEGARQWLERIPPGLVESADQNSAAQGLFAEAVRALVDRRLSDAIEELVRVWDVLRETERWSVVEYAFSWAADGAALLEETAAAGALAELYEHVPPAGLTRTMRAHGERLRAFAAVAAGDENAAADAFADALAAARNYGRAGHLAPVLADYGVWLAESGRADEAAPLLDEAQELWERMGAVRWLERLEAARPRAKVTT